MERYFHANRRADIVSIWRAGFAGLQGAPDVLLSAQWPDAIMATTARAQKAMMEASRQRSKDCEPQVSFVLSHLHVMFEEAPRASRGLPTDEAEERQARSRRRFLEQQQAVRVALTEVNAAKKQNDKELEEIAEHFTELIGQQVAAVKRHHPHREHLDSIALPIVTIATEARDIGQTSIVNAVRAFNTRGELDWFGTGLSAPEESADAPDEDAEDGSAA